MADRTHTAFRVSPVALAVAELLQAGAREDSLIT